MYPEPQALTARSLLKRLFATLLLAGTLTAAALAQPAALDGVQLQDHRRHALDAAALRGRPVLLNLVFTSCSTSCPLQVHELALVHRGLPDDVRRQVRFVSLTVDPLQDTPQTLAAFARRYDADRNGWHFATGAPVDVHRVLDRLQALNTQKASPQAADHRTSLYLYDAGGRLLQRYGGLPVDRPRLVAELTQVARMAARP